MTIDRRRPAKLRSDENAVKTALAQTGLERRKKVNRRRQIDPTTCERDYTDDEVEFMNALDNYKRTSGRMFPTCSEVLEVVRSLGYVRRSPSELAARGQRNRGRGRRGNDGRRIARCVGRRLAIVGWRYQNNGGRGSEVTEYDLRSPTPAFIPALRRSGRGALRPRRRPVAGRARRAVR